MKADPNLYIPFMECLRDNLKSLENFLSETEFELENNSSCVTDPSKEFKDTIEFLKEKDVTMPATYEAFYSVIGSIDFSGAHPEAWGGQNYPDPISIAPASLEFIKEEFEMWKECKKDFLCDNSRSTFSYAIAGDNIHKAGYSGGAYYLELDDPVDPFFRGERIQMRFLDYLRLCMTWGGFPGLALAGKHSWPLKNILKNFKPLPQLNFS